MRVFEAAGHCESPRLLQPAALPSRACNLENCRTKDVLQFKHSGVWFCNLENCGLLCSVRRAQRCI